VAVCALALRESLIITVFFTRSPRARSLLRAVRKMLEGGWAEVGALRTDSRTRWAGEGATIASVGANLPALQHTLLENAHSAAPIAVPAPVTAAFNSTAAAEAIRRASPFLCFLARVVEHLEADSAPLSSYKGVYACLRATLANHFTGISVAERQLLQGALERRFTSFSDPMVVLAFFLDPFWGPVRGRLSVLRWGGQSLADMRDAAVERFCGGDVSARAALLADMAGFAAIETAHGALLSERNLHPSLWWRLWGCPFRALQPVAARLLAIPPSAAGGERMFKTLKGVLTTMRNRLTNERVDAQSRLIFNTSQLLRPDVLGTYRRPDAMHELLAMLDGETGSGTPVQAPPPPPAADMDDAAMDGSSDGSDTDSDGPECMEQLDDDIAVARIFVSEGVEAAVNFLLS